MLKVIIVKWLQMIVPKPPGPVPMLKNWHWPPPPVPFLMNATWSAAKSYPPSVRVQEKAAEDNSIKRNGTSGGGQCHFSAVETESWDWAQSIDITKYLLSFRQTSIGTSLKAVKPSEMALARVASAISPDANSVVTLEIGGWYLQATGKKL